MLQHLVTGGLVPELDGEHRPQGRDDLPRGLLAVAELQRRCVRTRELYRPRLRQGECRAVHVQVRDGARRNPRPQLFIFVQDFDQLVNTPRLEIDRPRGEQVFTGARVERHPAVETRPADRAEEPDGVVLQGVALGVAGDEFKVLPVPGSVQTRIPTLAEDFVDGGVEGPAVLPDDRLLKACVGGQLPHRALDLGQRFFERPAERRVMRLVPEKGVAVGFHPHFDVAFKPPRRRRFIFIERAYRFN